MSDLTHEQLSIVRSLLGAGQRLAAIGELRATGMAFEDAARAVAEVAGDEVRPPAPEVALALESHSEAVLELQPVQDIIALIAHVLYGVNYSPSLDARGLRAPSAVPERVMVTLYPDSRARAELFERVSVEPMLVEIRRCLLWEGDHGAHPSPEGRDRVVSAELASLEEELRRLLSSDAVVYAYRDDYGLPMYYVFWYFAFLCELPSTGDWLAITGGASD